VRRLRAALPFLGLSFVAGCATVPEEAILPPPPAGVPTLVRPAEPERADFAFQGALRQGGLAIGTAPADAVAVTFDGKPVPLAPGGRFLIGFDRDFERQATIEARFADGGVKRETLRITPGQWQIESLPTLRRGTSPSPEFLRIRADELARIAAARAIRSGSNGWQERFIWPVTGRISGLFGSQRIYAGEPGAYHSGVDIARPTGTPIVAPASGVVILAASAPFSLEGNLLMIDHGMGLNSAFLHLSRIDVKVGDRVHRGQTIGAIGSTGRATGPHLHWSMKWDDQRVDPSLVAGPMPGTATAAR
jgi:murein DD-endopeptidase MepM/ murein hydrolase activator NlpD